MRGTHPTGRRGPDCLHFWVERSRVEGSVDVAASWIDRKSTRLNSSHSQISYAVFCLKKKKTHTCVPGWLPQSLGGLRSEAGVSIGTPVDRIDRQRHAKIYSVPSLRLAHNWTCRAPS